MDSMDSSADNNHNITYMTIQIKLAVNCNHFSQRMVSSGID